MTDAADKVGPAVVGLGRGWGRGSGVVVAPGQVLTVAHVLRGDEVAVTFAGDRTAEGRVAGSDPDLDVAVITVETGDVTPIAWEPQPPPPAGAPVLALANPGGRGLRTTFGLVSATGRGFRGPRGRRVAGSIEHTAPLPRGSSGGPLVDPDGNLLGLNAVRRDGGFILALPADAALRRRVDELARGEARRAASTGGRAGAASSGAPHARRRRPARARRSAGARRRRRQPRRQGADRARRPARDGRRPLADRHGRSLRRARPSGRDAHARHRPRQRGTGHSRSR